MTTFPYKGWGVPVGAKGAGQITATSFSVPEDALDFWRTRLAEHAVPYVDDERLTAGKLAFLDPSGLIIELVGAADDDRTPWTRPDIAAASAVRGIHSVTLKVREPGRTLALLTDVLGFDIVDQDGPLTRVASGGNAPGHFLDIVRSRLTKPDERIYHLAIEGLGVMPQSCLYVGDGEDRELTAAAKVGLHPVLIRTSSLHQRKSHSHQDAREWQGATIANLTEVLQLVNR
jgi:glyoxalase family protein